MTNRLYQVRLHDPVTEQGERDRVYWLDSWLKSYKHSDWAGVCPNHLYHDLHRMVLDDLLARGAQIYMIHVPDEPDSFMGFICVEDYEGKGRNDTVHYIHVKEPWRRNNIATQVIHDLVGRKFSYTFKTQYAKYFEGHARSIRFSPEKVRRKK